MRSNYFLFLERGASLSFPSFYLATSVWVYIMKSRAWAGTGIYCTRILPLFSPLFFVFEKILHQRGEGFRPSSRTNMIKGFHEIFLWYLWFLHFSNDFYTDKHYFSIFVLNLSRSWKNHQIIQNKKYKSTSLARETAIKHVLRWII